QQGLHGEALAIYRQLAVRRDDPALRQRIAELEQATPTEPASQAAASQAAESHDVANAPSGESVRAFFARIGAHRPTEHPHLAADEEGGLSSLFVPESVDDRDIAAAQSLAGAFTAPSGSAPHRG
ncbi:MAG TPA: hypothetical protein VGT98_06460, partial [Candidatus Elarobacter sp.]|nr:hypothetical protein [Candidatus Elarobacter sp.]